MSVLTQQPYLGPGPGGVDAAYAWSFTSGQGQGVGFVDVEEGWDLQHDELKDLNIQRPIFGVNPSSGLPHGTAVLGIVAGKNLNDHSGIATALRFTGVSSVLQEGDRRDVPGAIDAGAAELRPGDVLLLEEQETDGATLPIEHRLDVLAAIQRAVANKIIVVEAAGNGGQPLRPSSSGAILVGSVASSVANGGHEVLGNSNHGPGVDCYAWGDEVSAPGSYYEFFVVGALRKHLARLFTVGATAYAPHTNFGDTSAAAAIVAGVVALIQSIAKSKGQCVISPAAMRAHLKRADFGTPVCLKGASQGVMPDLRKILDGLGFKPP